MKNCLILLAILLFSGMSSNLNAQSKGLSIIEISEKTFLSLAPESSPKNMVWGSFGTKIESFYGIDAYSNGARKSNRKFQCTELVHRFLSNVYGIPSDVKMGLGHGKDLAENIAIRFAGVNGTTDSLEGYSVQLENFENGKSHYPPVVGSIVSMHFNSSKTSYGHVAIIRKIEKMEGGKLKATLFDQHGFVHKKIGLQIQADYILFKKDKDANWSGKVHSWLFDRDYPIISWTNPVVVDLPKS